MLFTRCGRTNSVMIGRHDPQFRRMHCGKDQYLRNKRKRHSHCIGVHPFGDAAGKSFSLRMVKCRDLTIMPLMQRWSVCKTIFRNFFFKQISPSRQKRTAPPLDGILRTPQAVPCVQSIPNSLVANRGDTVRPFRVFFRRPPT